MPKASHDLGLVSRLNAEALGKPGNRTFRLLVGSPLGSAILSLEKEQLLDLCLSIKRALGLMEDPPPDITAAPEALGPRSITLEFKIGRLAIEYDREEGIFRFWNHDAQDDSETAALVFEATGNQVEALSEEGLRVCSAGRPVCPLCHQPVDPGGHFCIRSNGHPADARERLK